MNYTRTKIFDRFVAYEQVPTATKQQIKIVRHGQFTRIAPHDNVTHAVKLHQLKWAYLAPHEPMAGPYAIEVYFFFPWRKNERRGDLDRGWAFHTTRPDADNIEKLFIDALCKRHKAPWWFVDDSSLYVMPFKIRTKRAGIRMRIYQLTYSE